MKTHDLKTWPAPFAAILSGAKRYEIRKDDRGFAVGDELVLREWQPSTGYEGFQLFAHYTGREIRARVTYKTSGGEWGLPVGLCVLGIEVTTRSNGVGEMVPRLQPHCTGVEAMSNKNPTVLVHGKTPSLVGTLNCELEGATPCMCGHRWIPARVDRVSWYWQMHGRDRCTLELPDLVCWCGLKRSEHVDGHAESP